MLFCNFSCDAKEKYKSGRTGKTYNERRGHCFLPIDASLSGKDDRKDANYEGKFFSLLKEDSDDIDALLSMEDVENKEYDDDEVRTARTDATYECNFPGSCSNYESPPRKRSVLGTSVIHCNYKKGERMRTMVKVLRRMVPGAKQMSTVTVLDEAVRYLKSLEAQVHNLETGIQNL
ncbi:uncharacterized protein [Primulina huaijiensis]|uniref:uncharacterized protein isoform X2 n=1 Tax=Primulina huaijiensis TaxID=1492673 RepID=UPI003CC78D55